MTLLVENDGRATFQLGLVHRNRLGVQTIDSIDLVNTERMRCCEYWTETSELVSTFASRLGDGTSLPSRGFVKRSASIYVYCCLHAGRLLAQPTGERGGSDGRKDIIIRHFAVVGSSVGSLGGKT